VIFTGILVDKLECEELEIELERRATLEDLLRRILQEIRCREVFSNREESLKNSIMLSW